MTGMDAVRDGITRARNTLVAAGAYSRDRAIQLEQECGGRETLISAGLRLRAAWLDLFAAMLGQRS